MSVLQQKSVAKLQKIPKLPIDARGANMWLWKSYGTRLRKCSVTLAQKGVTHAATRMRG